MRLINPGLGEILDRLSILGQKILFASEIGKSAESFVRERNALVAKINNGGTHKFDLTKPALDHLFELAAVNARLWEAEDDLRAIRHAAKGRETVRDFDTAELLQAGHLAIRIQTLNDRRAELVGLINAGSGDDHQEKLT